MKQDNYIATVKTAARIVAGWNAVKVITIVWLALTGIVAVFATGQAMWSSTDLPVGVIVLADLFVAVAYLIAIYVAWLLVGSVQSHIAMTRQIMIHTRPVHGNAVGVGGGAVVASSGPIGGGVAYGGQGGVASGSGIVSAEGGKGGYYHDAGHGTNEGGAAGTARGHA